MFQQPRWFQGCTETSYLPDPRILILQFPLPAMALPNKQGSRIQSSSAMTLSLTGPLQEFFPEHFLGWKVQLVFFGMDIGVGRQGKFDDRIVLALAKDDADGPFL